MYIFWDNSNIHFAGLNQVFPVKEPGESQKLYRTHFANLLQLVSSGRSVDGIFFAGSTPPKNDFLWKRVEDLGITVKTIPRCIVDGEANTTDHILQLELYKIAYDKEPKTIVLLTGDGAGINDGDGFLAAAQRIASDGWKFEVYSWDIACHDKLRKFAQSSGQYVKLEDYYENITFLEGKRRVKPL